MHAQGRYMVAGDEKWGFVVYDRIDNAVMSPLFVDGSPRLAMASQRLTSCDSALRNALIRLAMASQRLTSCDNRILLSINSVLQQLSRPGCAKIKTMWRTR